MDNQNKAKEEVRRICEQYGVRYAFFTEDIADWSYNKSKDKNLGTLIGFIEKNFDGKET